MSSQSSIKIACLLLALLCAIYSIMHMAAGKNMLQRRMKYINTAIRYSPKYFANATAIVRNDKLYIDMHINRTLPVGIRCYIDIQMKVRGSRKFQTVLSYDFDVCKILNEVFHESIIRTWYKNLLKYANLMENCPVVPGYYYIHNLTMEGGSIPVYLQSGDYRFGSYTYNGKRKTRREELVLDIVNDLQIL